MSQTVITTAFEQLKAQQAANGGVLLLDEFVFANVPNLNITDPIDRAESWPDASQIVHRQAVSKTGMVNSNAVVYSVVLGAEVGDFEFNWVGLISKASNTVCMIVHAPLQKKIKTASGQQGNVLTRSFLMEFNGASQQTQIITPADTWQIDFTARLGGVDERQRLENIDIYGMAGFLGEGWKVTKSGNAYSVKQGVGYVAGLRAELLSDQVIAVSEKPSKVWMDICWRGLLTSAWGVVSKITVAPTLANYNDNGERHYVYAVAEIAADGTVTDLRPKGSATERKFDDLPGLYLSRQNPFADIKSDGKDAVAAALANLDLVDTGKLSGRLLAPPTALISSGAFTMPAIGNLFRIRVQGGGGGSGSARATSSTGLSASGGGGAGAYVELWLTRAELQALITAAGGHLDIVIGAGGSGGYADASGNGGAGGTTQFGSAIICPGGYGSNYGAVASNTTTALANGGGSSAEPVITIPGLPESRIILKMSGAPGHYGISVQSPTLAGHGANSPLGNGGVGSGASAIQSNGKGYGSGAGGVSNAQNSAGKPGADGASGVIMLEIYA